MFILPGLSVCPFDMVSERWTQIIFLGGEEVGKQREKREEKKILKIRFEGAI
jgi:hypothetical protein